MVLLSSVLRVKSSEKERNNYILLLFKKKKYDLRYDKDARSNLISNLVLSFDAGIIKKLEASKRSIYQLIGYRRSLSSLSTSPRRLPLYQGVILHSSRFRLTGSDALRWLLPYFVGILIPSKRRLITTAPDRHHGSRHWTVSIQFLILFSLIPPPPPSRFLTSRLSLFFFHCGTHFFFLFDYA